MKVIYSEKQKLHQVKYEFLGGEPTPCFEKPERADMVLNAITSDGGYQVIEPKTFGIDPMLWVHTPDYVEFLQNAWNEWEATYGSERDASPYCFVPARHLRNRVPKDIEGKLGYYSFDMTAAITRTSFDAISSAVDCALTGVDVLVSGEQAAFALCRPPGHHASPDLMGATATSTTPRLPLKVCAAKVTRKSPFSISTITTVTGHKPCSTIVTMCCSCLFTETQTTTTHITWDLMMSTAKARAKASTSICHYHKAKPIGLCIARP